MSKENSKVVEIKVTLNTGFNMFLNPNEVVLKFKVEEEKPKRKYTKKKDK